MELRKKTKDQDMYAPGDLNICFTCTDAGMTFQDKKVIVVCVLFQFIFSVTVE